MRNCLIQVVRSSVTVALITWVLGFTTLRVASAAPEVVRIGFITPLTGPQAAYGDDAQKILQILRPRFADTAGNYNYEIILEDGQCGLSNSSVNAAQKLIHVDGVSFIVATCSGEVMQIAPITERAGVVVIGFAASHPGISGLGKRIFRNYVDMKRGIAALSTYIRNAHEGKVAVITEEAPFTLGIKVQLLAELGDRVAGAEDFQGGETDFRSLLLRIKAAKPAAYYLNAATPLTYVSLYKQLRQSGERQPVYSYYQPEDKDALSALGTLQDGATFLGLTSAFPTAEGQDLVTSFRARFPEGPRLPLLAATAWDSLHILKYAIDKVGPNPQKVAALLHTDEMHGAVGRIKFNSDGDIEDLEFEIKRIRDGQVEAVPAS